jgi:hypothetical protein
MYHILVIGLVETTNISSLFSLLLNLAESRVSYDSVASEINMKCMLYTNSKIYYMTINISFICLAKSMRLFIERIL